MIHTSGFFIFSFSINSNYYKLQTIIHYKKIKRDQFYYLLRFFDHVLDANFMCKSIIYFYLVLITFWNWGSFIYESTFNTQHWTCVWFVGCLFFVYMFPRFPPCNVCSIHIMLNVKSLFVVLNYMARMLNVVLE